MIIGFVKNSSAFIQLKLDQNALSKEEIITDLSQIEQIDLSLLIFDDKEESIDSVLNILQQEGKYCPLIPLSSLNLEFDELKSMPVKELIALYEKVSRAWTYSNNLSLIEGFNNYSTHLKDLWINDRNAFFEELWFSLKRNLATHELSIIFNDLKEPTDKQKEKGHKSELVYAVVKGHKKQQIFEGKEIESKLMNHYKDEFTGDFNISEYDQERGELVFTSKIKLSPILIMAKVNELTSLQRSLLKGIFSSLGN